MIRLINKNSIWNTYKATNKVTIEGVFEEKKTGAYIKGLVNVNAPQKNTEHHINSMHKT